MTEKKVSWLLTVLISIVFSVLSVFVYDRFFAQKIVIYDLKGFINQQRELLLSGKLTDEQFKRNVDDLEALMKATPKRKVVLMSDVVLRNGEILSSNK